MTLYLAGSEESITNDTWRTDSPWHVVVVWISQVEANSLKDVVFQGEVVISGIIKIEWVIQCAGEKQYKTEVD